MTYLIVAHPDDEVLWFSSVINVVKKIIICFSSNKSIQEEFPIKNVEFLNIPQFSGYHRINFFLPVLTRYGILIKSSFKAYLRYRRNFRKLITKLSSIIKEGDTVFTHNPWGEYGHEEHIQVYRAIEIISHKKNINIWHPVFAGFKTYSIVRKYIFSYDYKLLSKKVDVQIAKALIKFYKDKNAWTFDPEWKPQEKELFFSFKKNPLPKYAPTIPVRFLNIRW